MHFRLPSTWLDTPTWEGIIMHMIDIWHYPIVKDVLERERSEELWNEAMETLPAHQMETLSYGQYSTKEYFLSDYTNVIRFNKSLGFMPFGFHKVFQADRDHGFCPGTFVPYDDLTKAIEQPFAGTFDDQWLAVSGSCLNCGTHLYVKTAHSPDDVFTLMCVLEDARPKGYDYEWKPPTMS